MAYDPIIHFYDDPGHPYWPNNNMAAIKSEIMAIATEHGYTGAAPKTIADAIDALTDTLAGTDVDSGHSIASAIHALAPYIGSGGGGATLGELQMMPMTTNSQPNVGEVISFVNSAIKVVEMSIGEQFVFSNSSDNYVFMNTVAAGTTVIASVDRASEIRDISMYLVTGTQTSTGLTIETLEDFDLDVSVNQGFNTISFVMPEWNAEEGQFPIMYIKHGLS